jgi:hypothetical protein
MRSGDRHVTPHQEFLDAQGRAGPRAGEAEGQAAEVDRVEAVGVLVGGDRHEDLAGVEVARQGQLHDVAVHGGIGVELRHQVEKLLPGGVGRQVVTERRHPHGGAGLVLTADVGVAARIVTDENRGQTGDDTALRQPGHALGEVGLDRRRRGLAVQDQCRHVLRS